MEEKKRMLEGKLYHPAADEIMSEQSQYWDIVKEYNDLLPSDLEARSKMLPKIFGAIGEQSVVEPPFHANFGGKHVFIGHHFYANFNLTLVDDGNIYIGDYVMVGPNVTLVTAAHPIYAELREKGYQFNRDIHIGNRVWLGAGVIVLPGVTIGDDAVIGAGAVVSKDVPASVVAVGVPCRVLRKVDEKDREYFYKNDEIDWENLD